VGPQGEKTGVGNFDNLKTHSGKITDGVAGTTEAGHEDLIILVDETHATVAGNEAGDSLVVLFELHSHTFTDSRVGLLGFDTDLLDDDASGVGHSTEGLSPLGSLVRKFVGLVCPSVETSL